MVKNGFANICIIYQATDRRQFPKPWFSFPRPPHRAIAMHPIYYKFIAATSRISLKGLLKFNWNEEVKTLCSFLKDKAMHLSGLGASPNSCHHIKSLIPKQNVLEQFSRNTSNLSDKCKITQLGGKDCQAKT